MESGAELAAALNRIVAADSVDALCEECLTVLKLTRAAPVRLHEVRTLAVVLRGALERFPGAPREQPDVFAAMDERFSQSFVPHCSDISMGAEDATTKDGSTDMDSEDEDGAAAAGKPAPAGAGAGGAAGNGRPNGVHHHHGVPKGLPEGSPEGSPGAGPEPPMQSMSKWT